MQPDLLLLQECWTECQWRSQQSWRQALQIPSWEHEGTNHYQEDEVLSEWRVLFSSDWHVLTTSPGLISNLKAVLAPMYHLYLAIKE
jgi:hypothetical protein